MQSQSQPAVLVLSRLLTGIVRYKAHEQGSNMPLPSQIIDNFLYIGNMEQAASKFVMRTLEITHVVNVSGYGNVFEGDDLLLKDSEEQVESISMENGEHVKVILKSTITSNANVANNEDGGAGLQRCSSSASNTSTSLRPNRTKKEDDPTRKSLSTVSSPSTSLNLSARNGTSKQVTQQRETSINSEKSNHQSAAPSRFIKYISFKIRDSPDEDISALFSSVNEFIDNAKRAGGKVLVHCQAGVSRSASLVIAYLMTSQNMSFNEAYQQVVSRRPIIRPNNGFVRQLKLLHHKLHPGDLEGYSIATRLLESSDKVEGNGDIILNCNGQLEGERTVKLSETSNTPDVGGIRKQKTLPSKNKGPS